MRSWWAKRGPAHAQHHNLLKLYGLTGAQYNEMVIAQGGVCAVCGRPEKQVHKGSGRLQNLTVDHDHETGAIRGLLCVLCNTMIGRSVDRPAVLRAAADYLEDAASRAAASDADDLREHQCPG